MLYYPQTALTLGLHCWCCKQIILCTEAKAFECGLLRAPQLAPSFRMLDAQSMPSMPTAAGRVTCECLSTSWRSQGFICGGFLCHRREVEERIECFCTHVTSFVMEGTMDPIEATIARAAHLA